MPDDRAILINQLDIGSRLVRGLDAKGEIPKLTSPDYELEILTEDFTQPEYMWLRRATYWTRSARLAAPGAGLVNVWSLTNANLAASKVLAVVDQIWITNDTAANQLWAIGLSAQNTVGAFVTLDFGPNDVRQSVTPLSVQSAYNINAGTNAVALFPLANAGSFQIMVPANTCLLVPCHYILGDSITRLTGGSQSLFVSQGNLNVGGALEGVGFRWLERPQLQSEL